jgi:hypothetical protein
MSIPYEVQSAVYQETDPIESEVINMVHLHQKTGAGLKYTAFKFGDADPFAQGLGALATELHERMRSIRPVLGGKEREPFVDTFVSVSGVREHRDGLRVLNRELLGHFVIVRYPETFAIQVTQLPLKRVRGTANLGKARLVDEPSNPESSNVLYLPHPPGHYLVNRAIHSFPSRGTLTGPIVALTQERRDEASLPDDLEDEPAPVFLENIRLRTEL